MEMNDRRTCDFRKSRRPYGDQIMELREYDVDRVLAGMGRCSQCQEVGGCECDELRVAEMERVLDHGATGNLIEHMIELIDLEEEMLREYEAEMAFVGPRRTAVNA